MFHPIDHTVEVAIQGKESGQARVNVLAYKYSGTPPTPTELTNLGAAIAGAVLPAMEAAAVTTVSWQNIHLRDMNSGVGSAVDYPLVGPFVGLRSTPGAPGNVTLSLSKRTAFAGRSFRGRFYTVGPAQNDFPLDTATSAYVTLATNIGIQLLVSFLTGRFQPAVASISMAASNPIISVVIDTVVDSMRRRLLNRGR
jgi:hypothetical protein